MFLNSCLEIKTLFTPQELLKELLGIELQMGRVREIKWGPRIIDIDILFFDDEIIGEADSAVPDILGYVRECLFLSLFQR